MNVAKSTISPDLEELPFLNLDRNRTYLSAMTEDAVSSPVSIPGGFPFGNSNQTTVYVRNTGLANCVPCKHIII
jgi:hypothetical protein